MLKEKKEVRKREKQLKHLTEIAEAFLKARGVYPPDYEGFVKVAGQKEVDVFYQTMGMIQYHANKIGYCYGWFYDESSKEWRYIFDNAEEKENDKI